MIIVTLIEMSPLSYFLVVILFISSSNSKLLLKRSIKLFLYNEYESKTAEIQDADPADIVINPEQPIKVICHGLAANSSVSWYDDMIQPYLNLKYNIITVDWDEDANKGYLNAIEAAKSIGEFIAEYIVGIHFEFGISMDKVHIIGHSLGAHVGGFTGKHVYNITNQKIGRITGLDPAGPLFNHALSDLRLSKDDAKFVDVIHTNTGLLGISISIGHVDFYPDGGDSQNSCTLKLGCNHNIAPVYFIESITSKKFVAKKCSSYLSYLLGFCKFKVDAVMGEHCNSNILGEFYLTTNNAAPYGRG